MSQNPSNTGDASKKILKSSLTEAYDAAVEGVYEDVEGQAIDDTVLEEPTVLIRGYTGDIQGDNFPENIQTSDTYLTQIASFKIDQKQIEAMKASVHAKTIENAIDARISNVLRNRIDASPVHKELFDNRRNEMIDFLNEQAKANSIIFHEAKSFSDLCLQINRFGIYDTAGSDLAQSVTTLPTSLPIFGDFLPLNPYAVLLYNLNPWRWIKISSEMVQENFNGSGAPGSLNLNFMDLGVAGLSNIYKENNKLWDNNENLAEYLTSTPLGNRKTHLSHTRAAFNKKYALKSTTATMAQHLQDAKFYLNYGVPNGMVTKEEVVRALNDSEFGADSRFNRIEDHTLGFEGGSDTVTPVSYLGLKKDLANYTGYITVETHKNTHVYGTGVFQSSMTQTSELESGAGAIEFEGTSNIGGYEDPATGEWVPTGPAQTNSSDDIPPQPPSTDVNLTYQDGELNLSFAQSNREKHPGTRAQTWLTRVTNSSMTDGTYSPFNKLAALSSVLAYEATVSDGYDENLGFFGFQINPDGKAQDSPFTRIGLGNLILNHTFRDVQSLPVMNGVAHPSGRYYDLFKINVLGNEVYLYDKSVASRADTPGTDIFSEYIKPAIEAQTRSERKEKLEDLASLFDAQKENMNKMIESFSQLSGVKISKASGALSQRAQWSKSISPMPVFSAVGEFFRRLVTWHIQHTEDNDPNDVDYLTNNPTAPSAMITQMACLALTGIGTEKSHEKKDLRNVIVRALCFRDIERNESFGADSEYSRRVGYTSPMLSRIKATLDLTHGRHELADNSLANAYKALRLLIKDETYNSKTGLENNALFSHGIMGADGISSPGVASLYEKAFAQGSYVAVTNQFSDTIAKIMGNKSIFGGSVDIYDFILDVVDKIDEEVFGRVAETSNVVRDDYTDNEDILGESQYFAADAGVTKANRIDRSILIGLVVDVISDFLASVFAPRVAVEIIGQNMSLPGDYNFDDAVATRSFIELITVDKAKDPTFFITRNRQQTDLIGHLNFNKNTNGVEFVDNPGEIKKYTKSLNFRKALALFGACSYVTRKDVEYTGCLRVQTEQQFSEWYMKNYLSLLAKGEESKSHNEVVVGPVSDAFRRAFVQSSNTAILGVNGSDIVSHIKNAIMNTADSDKSAMKSIMEIYAIHAEHHRLIERARSYMQHTEEEYQAQGISTPAETVTTPIQAIKRHHLLSDYIELIQHDPGMCVPSLNFSFSKLIEKFLQDVETNPSKRPDWTEGRTLIKYGVSPGSFYDVVTDVLDGETNLNKVWDRKKVYVPVSANLRFEKKVAVETAIRFSSLEDTSKAHLNLMLNERHLKKTLQNLGDEEVSYREIVESLKFICPTQLSFLTLSATASDGFGRTWSQIVAQEDLGGQAAEDLYTSLEREVDCFCIRKFFQEIYALETDENVLMHGDQSELSKDFLEGMYQQGEFMPQNIDVSIQDIVEGLSVVAPDKTVTLMNGDEINISSRRRKKHNEIDEDVRPRLEIDDLGRPVVKKPKISKDEVALSDILFSSILSKEKFSFLGRPVFDKTLLVTLNDVSVVRPTDSTRRFLNPYTMTDLKESLLGLKDSPIRFYRPSINISLEF